MSATTHHHIADVKQKSNAAENCLVDSAAFCAGMARLSGACSIITTSHQGELAGLTATAVCSVSAEPPRLLVCVNENVRAHQLISESGRLGVNVLNGGHEGLARRFAGMVEGVAGAARFEEGNWCEGKNGTPMLCDALVGFECNVIEQTRSGTHSIFLCEVIDVISPEDADSALVYFNRNFVDLAVA